MLYSERSDRCIICGKNTTLSAVLKVCIECIRNEPDRASSYIIQAHNESRQAYHTPLEPPRDESGIQCKLCSNECIMGEESKGFCGLRKVSKGKLNSLSNTEKAVLHAYKDPHITNCCSAWFCPAATGSGYPKYAYTPNAERGYENLAVFFYGCNFDCLFCQNAGHKYIDMKNIVKLDHFVSKVSSNSRYSCICFFGGSPEPQLPFAIRASREIIEENPKRITRICFEWNGCGNSDLVKQAAELSLASGGNIKFDLKAFTPNLSLALSGVSNERAYENFRIIAREFYVKRPNTPILTATTLLVPGYVDKVEVEDIAKFIAELNPEIPYSLLVFHPDYLMKDLPITPTGQVKACYETAKKYLKNVNIGNVHLLWENF